ncbi:MAG: GTPase Era [Deltaproteobacteria bacterium SG8_13]|nr:MAG: GTPase Era [Deltaproteobacteria bacterium SG8_13]
MHEYSDDSDFKSGFVAIIGAPNVGKSTLLNRMLGEKISITSKKPQTTRNRVLGVLHRPAAQMIFLDTPGVHQSRKPLNVRIVETALTAMGDADLLLILVDVATPDPVSEGWMVEKLKKSRKPVILALNKIDLIKKEDLLRFIECWKGLYPFEAIVPISATKGTQLDVLTAAMEKHLPTGPPYFPSDTLTDLPERFIAAEMIREKVFRLTGEEIPYSAAVTVDSFKEEQDGALIRIHATIHLERESQKGIVIGRNGSKIKQIGSAAREDIQRFLAAKVFLQLFVRIQKNWSKDTKAIRKLGY